MNGPNFFHRWIDHLFPRQPVTTRNHRRDTVRPKTRPGLEPLEDRSLQAVGLYATLDTGHRVLPVQGLERTDHVRLESAKFESVLTTLPGPVGRAEHDPSSGVFRVVGTNRDDQFRVVESEGRLSVELYKIVDPVDKVGNHGQFFEIDIQTPGGPVRSIDASTLKKIEVLGWDGNDTTTFEYNRPEQREGGLQAARVSKFKFLTGNETRLPANLVVEIFGGNHDDRLEVSGTGGKAWGGNYFNPVSLHGGAGDDTLIGSIGDELLGGGADNDTLIGNQGTDELHGNGGHDTMFGDSDIAPYPGTGNDKLFGGAGVDTMHGGGGNDTLVGGSGNDFLHGDDDDDTLYGDQGPDAGAPSFIGFDHLYGGGGGDDLFGQAGDDYLNGEDDRVTHPDRLFGQEGNDTLIGGAYDGRDELHGGANTDVFHVDHYQGRAIDDAANFHEDEDELVKIGDIDPPETYDHAFKGNSGYAQPEGPEPPKAGDKTPIYGGGIPLGTKSKSGPPRWW